MPIVDTENQVMEEGRDVLYSMIKVRRQEER